MQERRRKSREAPTSEVCVLVSSEGRGASGAASEVGVLVSSESRQQRGTASGAGVLVSPGGGQASRPSGAGVLVSPEVRQDGVPMEVGTTRKRAAEVEADDGERASREETAGSARDMRSLSLLLAANLLKERRCFTEAATP
eukprot:5910667-Amphidinium_carterae.1